LIPSTILEIRGKFPTAEPIIVKIVICAKLMCQNGMKVW